MLPTYRHNFFVWEKKDINHTFVITHLVIFKYYMTIFFFPFYKRSTMEEFGISLKTIHDKLSEKDIPHTIEIDDMFSKMGSIDENGIKNEKEIYVMLQDVFSYMRDTGMIDSYLLIVFPEDYKEDDEEDTVDNILEEYRDNLRNFAPQHDEKSGAKLLIMKERVSNFIRVASLRDPDHIQKDNERYGDMLDLLDEMMNIILFLKGIYEGKGINEDVERIIAKQDAERAKIDKKVR